MAGVASFQTLPMAASAQEKAPPAIDLGASYVIDAIGVMSADQPDHADLLDNLDLTATLDLDRLIGWSGGTGHLHLLNNFGGNPNNYAGTLQGIDNIEVAGQRLRLFEAWIEQSLSRTTTVRAGLYDLNSEFYTNESAGLLIAPAFGVGSEIAATGPNGPSILPSTALSVRIDHHIGDSGYIRFAALNASAGTLGDTQGVNLTFNDGALLIAEAGIGRRRKIAVGGWSYTKRQNDIRAIDSAGNPAQQKAHGPYAVAEHPIGPVDATHPASAFLRLGISDGYTTPFRGGWQAGLLIAHPFSSRPDSVASIGVNQGYLSRGYRQNLRDAERPMALAETAFEVTYSDNMTPFLIVQPDLQIVIDPAGDKSRNVVFIAGMRIRIDL
ncbi:carbohydrate porin [Sphingomonas sp. Leaf339]|uniref:carbohydrate porin n=1 Tax=Sphingomonas sp. Leaf339 TaxID=1736343 RepID=UPI000A8186DB|nr:carbohydrate porin [Sphingomonas sp. Leaf339]